MLHVYDLPGGTSVDEKQRLWGARVEVLKDEKGKPYLYAFPMLTQSSDGSWLSYGWQLPDERPVRSPLAYERYLYSIKDIKRFRSAVRLRDLPLENFVAQFGFKKMGDDSETLQPWYVCAQYGQLGG